MECKKCNIYNHLNFRFLENGHLQSISSCKSSQIIEKGSVIFKENEILNGVYCIYHGVCKLSKLSSNGKSQIVRFVKQGEVLGIESIVSQEPVSLTAVALKDMQVCFIPREEILACLSENTSFSLNTFKDVCNELKRANNFIIDMAQKTVKQRLADGLLRLQEIFGTDTQGFIDMQLSREEIANFVGTATESLIRMLSEFSKIQLIETQGKRIKLLNENKLKKMAVSGG